MLVSVIMLYLYRIPVITRDLDTCDHVGLDYLLLLDWFTFDQCFGSVTFWYESGYGPEHWSKVNRKPI
jgi:hypothetical protein